MIKRSIQKVMFLVVLLLVGTSGIARAETQLKELGLHSFYGPELKSSNAFRQMIKETLPNLKIGFTKAGAAHLFDDFVAQAGTSNVTAVEVNPGEKLQWMIFRKGETVKVVKDVVWAGKVPFSAFLVQVDQAGTRYVFVVPTRCGNVSLAFTGPVPVAVAPVENVPPFCMVTVTPVNVQPGGYVTIDASKSSDQDGAIALVSMQVVDGKNQVVMDKKIAQPPYVQQITIADPGNYAVRVSVIDDKGRESVSPGCAETVVTVAPAMVTATALFGNFVADIGYMYQADPAHYLLMRLGYDYYFTDNFSLLGMVGGAPVLDGIDDTDSLMVDLTAHLHHQRMSYGAGVGFWRSSMDERADFIVNVAYRFYGEPDAFNIAAFVEGRAAFDQFDELADYGRIGAGLRFEF
ncbi:MAG: hypothetical protein OEL83_09740 [Desulforhopalus sp.]|nr:hypothetical protein [Desulforhopalus sp.]